jgi:hypothetical protein
MCGCIVCTPLRTLLRMKDRSMNLNNARFLALAICCFPFAASAQINEYGYGVGNVSEFMSRDLQFTPTWQSYQAYPQPVGTTTMRPATARPMAPAPLPSSATAGAMPLPKQTEYALRFFGGESARQTLQQMPQRASSGSYVPANTVARAQKPHGNMTRGHTISPWLNLDRPETSGDLPNYFTFVRPQFEQNDVNGRQQRELQSLQRKVQTASYNAPTTSRTGTPATGHASRFGDTGSYYGGWRR